MMTLLVYELNKYFFYLNHKTKEISDALELFSILPQHAVRSVNHHFVIQLQAVPTVCFTKLPEVHDCHK